MKRRSLNQNDFYFGFYLTAMSTGFNKAGVNWSVDDCHDFLKRLILPQLEEEDYLPNAPRYQLLPSGRKVPNRFSTTWLTTAGFEKYLDIGRAFASVECGGLQLPFPNEQGY
jgi:hypothetical protein